MQLKKLKFNITALWELENELLQYTNGPKKYKVFKKQTMEKLIEKQKEIRNLARVLPIIDDLLNFYISEEEFLNECKIEEI